MNNDIESMIQEKGLTAPRITPQDLEQHIVGDPHFYRVPGTTVTICVLTCRNGFRLVGHSSCVSAANFDEAIGQEVARKNALEQLWPLLGYELLSKLPSAADC